jgi:predicted TIM-barrel fold metal-dependent hydrolase
MPTAILKKRTSTVKTGWRQGISQWLPTGDEWIVFASDYSHFDSRFPGASQPIVNNPKLSDTSKRKILNDNASRLYPFER